MKEYKKYIKRQNYKKKLEKKLEDKYADKARKRLDKKYGKRLKMDQMGSKITARIDGAIRSARNI